MNKFNKFIIYNVIPITAGFVAGTVKSSGVEAYLPEAVTDITIPICLLGPTVGSTLLGIIETPQKKKDLEAKLNNKRNELASFKDSIPEEIYDLTIKHLEKKEKKMSEMTKLSSGAKSGIKTVILSGVGYFLGYMFAKLYTEA